MTSVSNLSKNSSGLIKKLIAFTPDQINGLNALALKSGKTVTELVRRFVSSGIESTSLSS
ncbi:MAG: hypothetical protein Q6362_012180 [Candidatus Wukongarchaeota archaeon]|nr:hypothetical protein [Candidatus Wukongarchaeota archaeon]